MTTSASQVKPPASDLAAASQKLFRAAAFVLHESAIPWIASRSMLCVGSNDESVRTWFERDAHSVKRVGAPAQENPFEVPAESFDAAVCLGVNASPYLANDLFRVLRPGGLLMFAVMRVGLNADAAVMNKQNCTAIWKRQFEIIDATGLFGDEIADPILIEQNLDSMKPSIFPVPDSETVMRTAIEDPVQLMGHFFFDMQESEMERALAIVVICRKGDADS